MLTDLRRRQPERPTDLVHMLLDCHDRIRSFLTLARVITERQDAPRDHVVDACLRVERYFTLALPLHIADEEESLLPRLACRSPELDHALHRVGEQHQDHEPRVAALLRASVAVRHAPGSRAERARLAAATSELAEALLPHLTLEEAVVFPAIRRWIPPDAQAAIITELRQRRGVQTARRPSAAHGPGRGDRRTVRISRVR